MQSKIFSGGFSQSHLHLFSKRTIKKLQELTAITGDEDLNKYFSPEGILMDEKKYPMSAEEQLAIAILHPRTDRKVDSFVDLI